MLLEVRDLRKYFPLCKGLLRRPFAYVKAVDRVSFHISKGETLSLVGESGCGKTTIAKCLVGLEKSTGGEILFNGRNLNNADGDGWKSVRRHLQIVFQDPFSSLTPSMRVWKIITEPLLVHGLVTDNAGRKARASELLELVRLEPGVAESYPHELSGGQRQRVAIIRALSLRPSLVLCDEVVSALDVATQAEIIDLLRDLQRELSLGYLLITHDLAIARSISHRIAVMYLGKLVEMAAAEELCADPMHPYTQALFSAVPIPDPPADRARKRIILNGEVPSALQPPNGCRFHPRCHSFIPGTCDMREPSLQAVGNDRFVSCHLLRS